MASPRYMARAASLVTVFSCAGPVAAAAAPCIDAKTIEAAVVGTMSARQYYLDCVPIADGKHPFLARLSAERRAAASERLRGQGVQALACSANPRDPARSGLKKKETVVLAECKPPRVGEVWPLP